MQNQFSSNVTAVLMQQLTPAQLKAAAKKIREVAVGDPDNAEFYEALAVAWERGTAK